MSQVDPNQPQQPTPPVVFNTQALIASGIGSLIIAAGTVLVDKGLASKDQVASFAQWAGPIIAGFLLAGGATLYKLAATRRSAVIKLAKEMPGVVRVVAAPEVANSPAFVNDPKVITPDQANAQKIPEK